MLNADSYVIMLRKRQKFNNRILFMLKSFVILYPNISISIGFQTQDRAEAELSFNQWIKSEPSTYNCQEHPSYIRNNTTNDPITIVEI